MSDHKESPWDKHRAWVREQNARLGVESDRDKVARLTAALAARDAMLAEALEALERIAEQRYSDAGEPFDDALGIADAALARIAALKAVLPVPAKESDHG